MVEVESPERLLRRIGVVERMGRSFEECETVADHGSPRQRATSCTCVSDTSCSCANVLIGRSPKLRPLPR